MKTEDAKPETFDLVHIVLYAKNWYEKSDNFWQDIYKCLTTTWYVNGAPHSYLMLPEEKNSMYSAILSKYTKFMHKHPDKIYDFIKSVDPYECWKSGYYTKDYKFYDTAKHGELPEYDYQEAVVRVILSNLGMMNHKHFPDLVAPTKKCLPVEYGKVKKFNKIQKQNIEKSKQIR